MNTISVRIANEDQYRFKGLEGKELVIDGIGIVRLNCFVMMVCGFGLVSKIGVWLFAKQYRKFWPIFNKIGGLEVPIVV